MKILSENNKLLEWAQNVGKIFYLFKRWITYIISLMNRSIDTPMIYISGNMASTWDIALYIYCNIFHVKNLRSRVYSIWHKTMHIHNFQVEKNQVSVDEIKKGFI